MNSSILTTHVGSLPRSKELSELLFAKDKKENIDQSLFNDTVKKNVDEVVKRQLDVGIDVVSDGEMSKINPCNDQIFLVESLGSGFKFGEVINCFTIESPSVPIFIFKKKCFLLI